jgi:hypothetical protein
MLSEEVRRLLAAYVDGELSANQREQADRLLRQSAEARRLLGQLQRDSGELRALRRRKLPQDFSQQVLRAIAEKKLKPGSRPPVPRPFPLWLGVGIAAAVLLAVTAASYLYFSSGNRPPIDHPDAPVLARQPLLRLPNLDLTAAAAEALGATLAREEAPHLTLNCQDPARAVERLEAALKGKGIRLLATEQAKAARGSDAKVRYLLYAEDVTPAELAALLQQVGGDDRREREAGRRGAGFGQVVVHPVLQEDRQELALLLGIDAAQLQPGASGRKLDLQTPWQSEKSQLATKGQKGGVRPLAVKQKQPQPQQLERFALVLAPAVGNVATSPEVREFLKRRGQVRPGTLQVIIEIQPALG